MPKYLTFLLIWLLPILCLAQKPAIQYSFDPTTETYSFWLQNEPPLNPENAVENPAIWEFYWEFGDGHYSNEKRPQHQFERGKKDGIKKYRIDLYLTPLYSNREPREISLTLNEPIAAIAYHAPVYAKVSAEKTIHIETNQHVVVPAYEFQVILSYQVPIEYQAATLLFFFNQKKHLDRDFDFDPKILRLPNGESFLKTTIGKLDKTVLTSDQCRFDYLDVATGEYKDVLVFDLKNVQKGKELRMFLSLLPNLNLPDKSVQFKALLVPEVKDCDERVVFEDIKEILPGKKENLATPKRAGLRLGISPVWGTRSTRLGEGVGIAQNLALVYGSFGVEKGWGFEVELAWSNFQFDRVQDVPIILPDLSLQNASVLLTSKVNISFIDVLIQQRYHINQHLVIGIGGGPSLLFNGKSQANAQVAVENETIDQVDKELGFGLFNLLTPVDALLAFPEADTTFDLGLTQNLGTYLGGVAFVEVGGGWAKKGIYGGIRYSFRWQNRIYNEPRVLISSPMVFFQWKFLQGSKD